MTFRTHAFFALTSVLIVTGAGSAAQGPCDIYDAAGTPCVAAHSSVRALYGSFNGNLYQVTRAKDNTTKDIPVLEAGGFANAKIQDDFCSGTTCTITILYDQSSKKNHLTPAPGGGANKTADKPVVANSAPLKVNGKSVYGMKFTGGMGYRNNRTTGIVTGDNAESMFMVVNGKHYNSQCCFDYGNAETTNNDDGEGTMEAIYFGNSTTWGKGAGTGPWVMADIENGLWAGNVSPNNNAPSINADYVMGMVKGKSHTMAVKWGNAVKGPINTYWEGAYPLKGAWGIKYDPMRKQGAIILGIGGDNSNWAVGTFYEGAMTTGYSTNATDSAIQANIVSAGYGSTIPVSVDRSPATIAEVRYDASRRSVSVGFSIDQPQEVNVDVLDLQGRAVSRIQQGFAAAGTHQATWNASRSARGVYMVRISGSRGLSRIAKIVLGE